MHAVLLRLKRQRATSATIDYICSQSVKKVDDNK